MISIRRLFGLLLLFLFFEVAIWVLGTFLLPDTNILLICAVMTGIAVVVWLIYVLLMRWMMRPRIPPAPFPRPGPIATPVSPQSPGDPEAAALKELIKQAEQNLAASPAFSQWKQKPRLAQLPLYLVVGSESAGKTSALLKSELDPRLLAGESFREGVVVPTKLCNLYFAAGSVIVDVGSRIFEDAERWNRFLSVLLSVEQAPLYRRLWEGHTPQRNLRGVLLCCAVATFLRASDPRSTTALSQKVQERLESLGKVARSDFAAYTLFTRADSLPYFEYFFDRLSDDEDRQILGCSLPLQQQVAAAFEPGETHNEAERKRFTQFFNRLYAALANKRLPLLARETVAARKPAIYEFPREFKRIRPEITNFLVDTFRPNPLHPGPKLRGFYFSGLRKVTAAQSAEDPAALSQVRAGFGATIVFKGGDLTSAGAPSVLRPSTTAREHTTDRWVFLSKLFRDVILADKAWVSPSLRDTRLEMYRSLAFGAAALACLLLAVAFVTSLTNNRRLVYEVEDAVRIAQAPRPDPAHLTAGALRHMDLLREKTDLLSGYHRDGAPLGLRWGLYSGNAMLPGVRGLYFAQFREVFLAPILDSIAARFNHLNAPTGSDSYDDIYENLKTYRTVTSGSCAPDSPLLLRVLSRVWLADRSLDGPSESLARRQIAFYVSELLRDDPYNQALREDAGAAKQAQAYLLGFKGPEQIYRALIAAVNQTPQRSERLAEYAPNYSDVLTGPSEVPTSFTRRGWDLVEQRIRDKNFSSAGESCVVGANRSSSLPGGSTLQNDVQNLYVKNYIKAWHDFLAGQGIAPYRGVSDAVGKLGILSGNRSPLLAVLLMIADNTNFPNAPASGSDQFRAKVEQGLQSGLGRILPRAKKGFSAVKSALPEQAPPQLSQADITKVFQPVRTIVTPGNRDRLIDEPNRGYINSLAELRAALNALPQGRDARIDVSMNNQARQAVDKAHASVRDAAQRFNISSAQGTDTDLVHFLEMPIDFTDAYVPKDPMKPLRDRVNGQLRMMCVRLLALQRKFPFNGQADAEATDQDLAVLFAPHTGAIWSFEQLPPPLTGLLIKQGDLWMQNPAIQDPHLTPEFIEFFNHLASVSSALFPDDGTRPHLEYMVQPLSAEGVDSVKVNIGGTVISSTGRPVAISWPPPPGSAFVDLQLTMNGVGIPFGRYEGQWAIFRLMQDGEQQGRNTFLFRNLRQGHGKPQQVTNSQGSAVAVRLMIQFPSAFDPRTFRARCPAVAAQ